MCSLFSEEDVGYARNDTEHEDSVWSHASNIVKEHADVTVENTLQDLSKCGWSVTEMTPFRLLVLFALVIKLRFFIFFKSVWHVVEPFPCQSKEQN